MDNGVFGAKNRGFVLASIMVFAASSWACTSNQGSGSDDSNTNGCATDDCSSSCSDECLTEGARQCQGDGAVVFCGDYDGDGCNEWGGATACDDGATCSNGQCAFDCVDECGEAFCGDGEISGSETCDGECPTACNDGDFCTTDTLVGSADECNAYCAFDPISACIDDDGCCAPGCDTTNDSDCVGNSGPAAVLACPTTGLVTLGELSFDLRMSTDDHGLVGFHFDFGDGTTVSPDSGSINDGLVTHVYEEAGQYWVTGTVTDADGMSDSATCLIDIKAHDVWFYDRILDGVVPALDSEGNIYVFDQNSAALKSLDRDGVPRWQTTNLGIVTSSPSIGPDRTIYAGYNGAALAAYNPDTGNLKWERDFVEPGLGSVTGVVFAEDGTLYASGYLVASDEAVIWSLDANDGTTLWSFPAFSTGSNISLSVNSQGRIIFGTTDGTLYALHPNGSLAWSVVIERFHGPPVIGADDSIYVFSLDGTLYAISVDGSIQWSVDTGSNASSQGSPALGADGSIYTAQANGRVTARNPDDGSLIWSVDLGAIDESTPAVTEDGTIVIGTNARLYGLGPEDGSVLWSSVDLGVCYPPTIGSDGMIYVQTENEGLHAIWGTSPLSTASAWPKYARDMQNSSTR